MKNLIHVQRKKAQKEFEIGDVVTWGVGTTAHRVIEINPRGIVVDVTSCLAYDPHNVLGQAAT